MSHVHCCLQAHEKSSRMIGTELFAIFPPLFRKGHVTKDWEQQARRLLIYTACLDSNILQRARWPVNPGLPKPLAEEVCLAEGREVVACQAGCFSSCQEARNKDTQKKRKK